MLMSIYVCPDCGGDGKETCHNPDHGFISANSWNDIGRIGCPCCGHNEYHKIANGDKCETCNGTGEVSHEEGITFLNQMKYDFELEEIKIQP